MRTWITSAMVGFVLTASVSCAPAELTPEQMMAIEEEVVAFLDRFSEAANGGDVETLAAFYEDSDSFRWIENGRVTYSSVDDIRASLAQLAESNTTTEMTVNDRIVTVLDADLSWVDVSYQQRFEFGGGGSFELTGVMTFMLRRGADGWKVAFGHVSNPRER